MEAIINLALHVSEAGDAPPRAMCFNSGNVAVTFESALNTIQFFGEPHVLHDMLTAAALAVEEAAQPSVTRLDGGTVRLLPRCIRCGRVVVPGDASAVAGREVGVAWHGACVPASAAIPTEGT